MTQSLLCPAQISALEFQTTQAYEALARVVETRHHQDAVWAEKLYVALQTSLNVATGYSNYIGFQRDKTSVELDKAILQYIIGEISSIVLENAAQDRKHGNEQKAEKTTMTEESFKEAIDSNVPYIELKTMAMKLAKAHKYDIIVNLVRYVREEYKRTY